MKKAIYLFLLLPLLFVACGSDDDDDTIRFYTLEDGYTEVKSIEVGKKFVGYYVAIEGGDGAYGIASSDQHVIPNSSIGMEKLEGHLLLGFTPENEGESVITVTDGKGNSAKLKVTVKAVTEKWTIQPNEAITVTVPKTLVSEILLDLKQNNLQEGNSFILTYDGAKEGTVDIYSDAAATDKKWDGTFRLENNEDETIPVYYYLIMKYNGREHRYAVPRNVKSSFYPKSEVLHVKLVDDLTAYYQKKYPTEEIEMVEYSFTMTSMK